MRNISSYEGQVKRKQLVVKRKKRRVKRIRLLLILTILIVSSVFVISSKFKSCVYNKKNKYICNYISNDVPEININDPLYDKTIVVDAGHGGKDPGAIGASGGVYESEINLQMANILANELKKKGANVVMTRTDESTKLLGETNKLSMDERERVIVNANADMVISLHQNYNENSNKIKGVQILLRQDSDIAFASKLQQKFNSELNVNLNYIQDKYTLLEFGNQPSFIIECGFLSNPEEEIHLQSYDYQKKIIDILINELDNYWGNENND